jgi:hypothetical protein
MRAFGSEAGDKSAVTHRLVQAFRTASATQKAKSPADDTAGLPFGI